MALADIDHIVILMQENRSFDHVLGYLSKPGPNRMAVDGVGDQAWADAYTNVHKTVRYPPYRLEPSVQRMVDPAHGYDAIARQIDTAAAGAPNMGGFVASYATQKGPPKAADYGLVMGHYEADGVPVYDFLARNFAVCDRWFAALPASTQPNKIMALGGEVDRLDNTAPLPGRPLVYDWLAARGEHLWCVYQWGALPFAALMKRWLGKVMYSLALSDYGANNQRFRHFNRFGKDWRSTKRMPPVIFMEPEYSETPQSDDPNDDHAPTGMARGQAFVAEIYNALISNPARWARTMFIITYDEHGGFFDHVPPPPVPERTIGGKPVKRLGVRVPALVVSPQVAPGSVFHETLDHNALLQLIADKLAVGSYSPTVDERTQHLGGRLSRVLGAPSARRPVMPPETVLALSVLQAHAPPPTAAAKRTADPAMRDAFNIATREALVEYPDILGTHPFRSLEAAAKSLAPPPAPPV